VCLYRTWTPTPTPAPSMFASTDLRATYSAETTCDRERGVFHPQCVPRRRIWYDGVLHVPLTEVFPIEMSAVYYRLEEQGPEVL